MFDLIKYRYRDLADKYFKDMVSKGYPEITCSDFYEIVWLKSWWIDSNLLVCRIIETSPKFEQSHR